MWAAMPWPLMLVSDFPLSDVLAVSLESLELGHELRAILIFSCGEVGMYRFRKFKTQTPGARVVTPESTPGGCVILVIG